MIISVMSSLKDQLIKALEEAAGVKNPQLEFPEREEFGDYSSNVAIVNKLPVEEIIGKLNKMADLPAKAEAKAGFINFRLKKDVLIGSLNDIDIPKIGRGKTVVIDYSSPNVAKPFGIGHLRSTIVGQVLYNLYKSLGYEVIGDNHLGDWGTQFGKLLYMIDKTKTNDFSIENLEKLYVEFHEHPEWENDGRAWFKKLEEGDSNTREIWQKCVEVSMAEFERIYKILGVKIDLAFGESYYESEMKAMMDDSKIKKFISEGEEGAKVINLNGMPPLMFLKGDGATTYATRDMATIIFRVRKWNPDIFIYEVGAEQTLYFRQLFAAARLMGIVKDKVELVHTAHGLYLAPDGKKFSTRKGKTVKLEEVLIEAIERAKKLQKGRSASAEATARQVGIGAIKYFDLSHQPTSDITFDWEKMMAMEGNSGPYLQYTVARTNSVLAKASVLQGVTLQVLQVLQGYTLQYEEVAILRKLAQFQEIIINAAKTYSPNILCNYLYDLASKFNTFYNKHRIIGGTNYELRVMITKGVGQVLKNGLNLLGISAPERM